MIELLGLAPTARWASIAAPKCCGWRAVASKPPAWPRAEVRRGDMYALPGTDGSVDTVVLHQVLHFADDPAAVIAEAARVLAPGGRLLVIDFMPHEREESARTSQRHVRLGLWR